jgi:glycosyltransferase involved in cell wall biosynthesis
MGKLEQGGDVPAQSPLISVVMPVHNALPYLDESIKSILGQTLKDFEFVILDDASTDGSSDVLNEWAKRDERIRLHRSEQNLGLSGSSNLVVKLAHAPLIARMDADDVSCPGRLMCQLEVMKTLPDVALVGTLCDGIDAEGRRVRPRDRWRLIRRSEFPPFPHGSVMFRRADFEEVGGYNEQYVSAEDQELFLRLARSKRVVVLPDVLYHYRYHQGNSTIVHLTTTKATEDSNGLRRFVHDSRVPEGTNGTDLRALRSAASMQLWAGQHPKFLSVLLADGALGWNAQSVYTLAWATWARVSPGSLRACLRGFIRARDLMAGSRHRDGRVCEWRFE